MMSNEHAIEINQNSTEKNWNVMNTEVEKWDETNQNSIENAKWSMGFKAAITVINLRLILMDFLVIHRNFSFVDLMDFWMKSRWFEKKKTVKPR